MLPQPHVILTFFFFTEDDDFVIDVYLYPLLDSNSVVQRIINNAFVMAEMQASFGVDDAYIL